MKRVMLIQPKEIQGVQWAFYPPSGLLSLATVLKKKGFEILLLDVLAEALSNTEVASRISAFQPEYIGISINTMLLDHAIELAEVAKMAAPEALIIAGGPHVTCVKEDIFSDIPLLDAVFIGEAEETLPEFLNADEKVKIQGVIWKGEIFDGIIPFVDDLDKLPFPDFSLVGLDRYYGFQRKAKRPTAFINCSRGCYYNCFFCSNPVRKRPVRFRSVQSVIDELLFLKKNYNVKEVFFMDDMFNSNVKWAENILSEIIQRGLNDQMRFVLQFRVNEKITPPSLFELAAKSGVYCIIFGVESGSQKILDKTNKKIKVAEIERAFDLAKKFDLSTVASFILGLPGEDDTTISDTIRLFQKIKPSIAGVGFATPLPGTDLRKQYQKDGHLNQEDFHNFSFCKCIVRTESLSSEQLVQKYQQLFETFKLSHIVE